MPLTDPSSMRMKLINEYLTSIVIYVFNMLSTISESGMFIDDKLKVGDPDKEYQIGQALIAILLFMLGFNLSQITISTFSEGY